MTGRNRNDPDFLSELSALSLALQQLNKSFEAETGLSLVQMVVLRTLRQMPATSPKFLAKSLSVTPGTLSQTLSRLERRRLLIISPDPRDARRKMVSITREGLQAFEASFDTFCDRAESSGLVGLSLKKVRDVIAEVLAEP